MPANETIWRNLKTMHIVFALSSFALVVVTLWMLADDHGGEWKVYQKTFFKIEAEKLRERQKEILTADYTDNVAQLEQKIQDAEDALVNRQSEIDTKQEEIDELANRVDLIMRDVRLQRQVRDVARANLGLAIRDARPEEETRPLRDTFAAENKNVTDLELQHELELARLNAVKVEMATMTTNRDTAQGDLKKLQSDFDLAHTALQNIDPDKLISLSEPSSLKRKIMEWPIIDGFNSHLKIRQDWLPELKVQLGMARTARFDRCRTCHIGIDRVQAGGISAFPHGDPDSDNPEEWVKENKFPHPYSTHPRLDVYLTATSPHPLPLFGCTACHDGDGSGTSFQNAEHSPNNPAQAEKWTKEFGHHSNHFWEYPMLPTRLQESSCLKCHHNVTELGINDKFGPTAPKLYEGFQAVSEYGCFGCHEIRGYEGETQIGPDMRLEPNYNAAALQLLHDEAFDDIEMIEKAVDDITGDSKNENDAEAGNENEEAIDPVLLEIQSLAKEIARRPDDTEAERKELQQLIADDVAESKKLSKESQRLAPAFNSETVPGKMRKTGPSLRYLASKTTRDWVEFWTKEPKAFRPTTRMPQFFGLSNQQDAHAEKFEPVQIAGITQYLLDRSQDLDLLKPVEGYKPNAERGKELFSKRGCLACHSHEDFPKIDSDFGPNLTNINAKMHSGDDGFNWLYTWIIEPQRHHPRTRMPNLYLTPYTEAGGGAEVDPAADIAAYLLQNGPAEYDGVEVTDEALNDLTFEFLKKAIGVSRAKEVVYGNDPQNPDASRKAFPLPESQIKGDEIELWAGDKEKVDDPEEWREMKLNYIGRRMISTYGCYACHDIPGFELARPIGTALQDWGRKDTSKLAKEHIMEYLHHHGEPDGSSTHKRMEKSFTLAKANEFSSEEEKERELSGLYFYDSLMHHGRAGFLWQKLRAPRSYDFEKTGTKDYNDRLRMPKFPFDEQQIEAVATFVLGLVADPPDEQYVYSPGPEVEARLEGERLLAKYNCTSCHMVDMPEITYALDRRITGTNLSSEHPDSIDLLMKIKPPRQAETGKTAEVDGKQVPIISFHGLKYSDADPEEDPEFQDDTYDTWETLQVGEELLLPGSRMVVNLQRKIKETNGRGGEFALWLVDDLVEQGAAKNRSMSWQMSPPPLYEEGYKVQTPWLYQFLLDPVQLRHTTVLRMPQFNMSSTEARGLANYFAAKDREPYPYQAIPQKEAPYLSNMQKEAKLLTGNESPYLEQGWKVLNANLCIGCHSVGNREVKIDDPEKDIRGPNLEYVPDRLRPDWLLLWLYKPQWITPYTSMPAPFPHGQMKFEGLLGGDADLQTKATRDALMNYHRLIERYPGTVYSEEAATGEGAPSDTGEGVNPPAKDSGTPDGNTPPDSSSENGANTPTDDAARSPTEGALPLSENSATGTQPSNGNSPPAGTVGETGIPTSDNAIPATPEDNLPPAETN